VRAVGAAAGGSRFPDAAGVTHTLLPAFVLAWRLDAAEDAGAGDRADRGRGVRRAAGRGRGGGAIYDGAGWVRRFAVRAGELASGVRGAGGGAGRGCAAASGAAGRFAVAAIWVAFGDGDPRARPGRQRVMLPGWRRGGRTRRA